MGTEPCVSCHPTDRQSVQEEMYDLESFIIDLPQIENTFWWLKQDRLLLFSHIEKSSKDWEAP